MRSRRIDICQPCLLLLLGILAVCGLGVSITQAQGQAPPRDEKTVLILHALEANMPLNVRTDRAIRASLEAGGVGLKAQFYEYLDLHRHPARRRSGSWR